MIIDGTWQYQVKDEGEWINVDRSPMHSFDDCAIHKDDLPKVIAELSRLLESVTEHKGK